MSSSKSRRRLEGTEKVKSDRSAKDLPINGTDNSEEDNSQDDSDSESRVKKDVKSKRLAGSSQPRNYSLSDDVKKLIERVTCCSCGKQINVMNYGAVRRHPWLKVVTCKKCFKFLKSGPFTLDNEGIDEQCRWCGNGDGDRLYGCDYCHNCFCRSCIERNLGRSEATKMEAEDGSKWHCYMCKPKKIKKLVEDCDKILDYVAREEKRDKEAEERRMKREMEKAARKAKEDSKELASKVKVEDIKKKDVDSKKEDKVTLKKGFPASEVNKEIKSETKPVSGGANGAEPELIVLDDSPLKISEHQRSRGYKPDPKTGVLQVQKANNGVLEVMMGPEMNQPVVNTLLGGIDKCSILAMDIDATLERIKTLNLQLSQVNDDIASLSHVDVNQARQMACYQVRTTLKELLNIWGINNLRDIWGDQSGKEKLKKGSVEKETVDKNTNDQGPMEGIQVDSDGSEDVNDTDAKKNDNDEGSKEKEVKESKKEKEGGSKIKVVESDSSSNDDMIPDDVDDSEDDTDNLSASQLKKLKQASKAALEESDEGDDVIPEEISSDSDPEVLFPKPGSSKKGKKHDLCEASDDSDFVSTKKNKRLGNKLLDVKISDSESDSKKKGKKGKRGAKRKSKADSDEFSELSDEEENRKRGKGRKRRRIKRMTSSDEEKVKEPGEFKVKKGTVESTQFKAETSKKKVTSCTRSIADTQLQDSAQVTQDTPSTSSQGNTMTKRSVKLKFVGRSIKHKWEETDGSSKWYSGTVVSVKGKDGDINATYEVYYDIDGYTYDVDSLYTDYEDGSLKFTDI